MFDKSYLQGNKAKLLIRVSVAMMIFNLCFSFDVLAELLQFEMDKKKASEARANQITFKLRDRPPSENEFYYMCAHCATLPPKQTKYYAGPTNFIWPVNGRIVGEYDDPMSLGLLIAVPIGSEVRASDDGEIVSAGYSDALGKLVLIRHSNGFISIYGHNSELLVSKGIRVRRGQVIAKSGSTGKVGSPLLLFGLRHPEIGGGHEVLNPRIYL